MSRDGRGAPEALGQGALQEIGAYRISVTPESKASDPNELQRSLCLSLEGRCPRRVEHPHGEMDLAADIRWLVLVEGPSDRTALETLARRCGHDLERERVELVSIGGAHAIGSVLSRLVQDVRVAGLCDEGEIRAFGRGLERVGIGPAGTQSELEQLGFYACRPDLEGELIRSLGAVGVEAVLERSGKISSFRTFQKQPQWHNRPVEDQLRRFFGSSAGKIRYAPLLVEALELERVPRPLAALLAHVTADV